MTRTLTLPLPPNRGNERGHWRTRKSRADAWYRRAYLELYRQAGPPRNHMQRVADTMNGKQWRIAATFYVWARMDDDNAVARLKLPLDLLKKFGLIVDDKRPYCVLENIPEQVVDRKSQRVELTLTEAE